jgi:hypothetical protein
VVQIWATIGGGSLFLMALLIPVAMVTVRQYRRREAEGG